jgi:hypothetical protein
MNAITLILWAGAIYYCSDCGYTLYKPHLSLSNIQKYILYTLCILTIIMFFLSLFFPITYGVGLFIASIKEYYECHLNEEEWNYPGYQNIYKKSSAFRTLFADILFFIVYFWP